MSETKAPSTSEQIFLDLRRQIMTGDLAPGSRHSIYALAETLHASRTPVREAVLRLADLHLVTIHKNRGVVIRHVEPDDIEAVFEMRLLVEGAAVAHAARHDEGSTRIELGELSQRMLTAWESGSEADFLAADRAWHGVIIDTLGNAWAERQIQALRYATPPSLDHQTPRPLRLRSILDEHSTIERAVFHNDPAQAMSAMQIHLRETARSLLDQDTLAGLGDTWPGHLERHFVVP